MIETVAPEGVGMATHIQRDIDKAMQAFVDQDKIAGIATLIARRGRVVQFGCYGKLELATDKPLQRDSLFRIYSLTKPITSVAALMLLEEGRFGLDDPVSKWIPEFSNFKVLKKSPSGNNELDVQTTEITFWHLLTHTSGLGYGFNTEPIEEIYRDANIASPILTLQLSLPEMVQKVVDLPLSAQPGTTWHYSVAHDVLGFLIEIISGKPFDVFLNERIFEPLGMRDTAFNVPQEKLERFGPLYNSPEQNGLSVIDDVTASPFVSQDVVPSGGGGLVSSMPDYFRFMLMLANGGELDGMRLVESRTITAMTTNQLTGSTFPVTFNYDPWIGMGFGLGIGVKVTDPQQFGWIGVSGTSAWIYPSEEMIVIAMPQALFYWEASDKLLEMAREAIVD